MHSLILSPAKAPGFPNAPAGSHFQASHMLAPLGTLRQPIIPAVGNGVQPQAPPSSGYRAPRGPSFEGLDFRDGGGRRSRGQHPPAPGPSARPPPSEPEGKKGGNSRETAGRSPARAAGSPGRRHGRSSGLPLGTEVPPPHALPPGVPSGLTPRRGAGCRESTKSKQNVGPGREREVPPSHRRRVRNAPSLRRPDAAAARGHVVAPGPTPGTHFARDLQGAATRGAGARRFETRRGFVLLARGRGCVARGRGPRNA